MCVFVLQTLLTAAYVLLLARVHGLAGLAAEGCAACGPHLHVKTPRIEDILPTGTLKPENGV